MSVSSAEVGMPLPVATSTIARANSRAWSMPGRNAPEPTLTSMTSASSPAASSPAPLNFPPIGSYNVKISVTNKNAILYQRELVFGSSQVLLFDAKAYPVLKQVFENIHARDSHMLTLKPAAETSAQLQ
jgi:hypothetical protein